MSDEKKSLADMASGSVDRSQLSPAMRTAANAVGESARRNPSNSVWTDRRKARGPGFPFFLKKGEKRKILILTEPTVVVAHKYTTGWANKGGYSFAETEWGVCSAFTAPANPDQQTYDKTGKPCPGCMAFGEPRTIMTFIICEFYDKPVVIRNKSVSQQVRLMIVDSITPQNQLIDNAMTKVAGGSLRGCFMNVSRSQGQQSPRVGDSFTVEMKVTKAQIQNDAAWPMISSAMADINLVKAYEPLTPEEYQMALTRHKQMNDRHNNGDGYDPEGMDNALRGNLEQPADIDDKASGGSSSSGSSLAALAGGGGGGGEETVSSLSSLANLKDVEEGTTEIPDSENEGEGDSEFSLEDTDGQDDKGGDATTKAKTEIWD